MAISPPADVLQQSSMGPTAQPHTCMVYAGSSCAERLVYDGDPRPSHRAEQVLMLSAAAM